ncbi:hypothetical protein BJP34_19575 [Moorena producens PAL-8-15-08-1]|uniref:Uncharacterized protein n=1 Tax=Moorena producens PAL-8-15-08-1 TaxID=1458985 RepID=A0A1D8TUS4_9CYAN|nr:hypothetical protein BJP34_19575 [Moorena producens PAL-8-15-08-1]
MSTIIATKITTTPADVGWAVQQTNQLSSPSPSKALPTNGPPQHNIETGKMPVPRLMPVPPSKCRVGSAAEQSVQLPIP